MLFFKQLKTNESLGVNLGVKLRVFYCTYKILSFQKEYLKGSEKKICILKLSKQLVILFCNKSLRHIDKNFVK